MGRFNVYDCSIIELDRHHSDRKGNLTVVENGITLPFDVKRVYYLYDVPGGESRGAHAHKELEQLVELDLFEVHGRLLRLIKKEKEYVADFSAYEGLYIGLPYNIPFVFR